MSHTPGPWIALFADDETDRCEGIVNQVAYEKEKLLREAEDWEHYEDYEEIVTTDSGVYGPGRADALLIAAAPELLEALEGVVRVADRKTKEFDAARAAIKKAKGQ